MNVVRLLVVGDISLQTKNNKHPFENIKHVFKGKDILFGNLETALSNSGKEAEKAVVLHVSPDKVLYLKDAGFDIVNVANNHIMDLGPEGFNETLEVLNQNDLIYIGAGNRKLNRNSAIVEINRIKIGFLGYNSSGVRDLKRGVFINKIDEAEIIRDIENLKPQCEAIIISLHWGIEKVFYPLPQQIEMAHRLIDASATVILGHHPHVIQGIETYNNGLIVYSLGNFQFEFNPEECFGKRNKRTNQSIILSLKIGKNGLKAFDIIPLKINEEYVPCMVTAKEEQEINNFISKISLPLTKGGIRDIWWYSEIAEEYLLDNMKSWIIRIKRYGVKHLLQCAIWIISPFVIKCYLGWLTKKLKQTLCLVKDD